MSGRGIPLSSRLSSLSLRSQSVSIKSCQKTDPPPETLKIKEFRQEIIDKVNNNQVTLISAETGSGKSTQVPQFIMDEAISKNQPYNIIVTQPRKIAAITIATRVADERNSFLGEEIGYQVGLRKKMSAEEGESRLLFCTTGVVLQKLIQLNTIDQYSHVILDEIHERELDMELLMIIIRELLLSNTTTKIILMSATFNPQPFVDYFTLNDGEELQKPAVMELKTNRNFEININYLNDIEMTDYFDNGTDPGISSNMYEVARKIIEKRITKSTKSILVFLPGIFEIQTLYNTLKKDGDIDEKALVCFLHSSMATVDQQVAFKAANKPKVILSTNIAESSVTIDSVDCVIDFCLTKYIQRDRNSKTSMASLKLDWASKTNLEQRAGRTGRTCDGIVYRLIYRLFYDRLMDYTTPEMQRCPLETVVLRVKLLNHGSPMEQSPTVFLAKALSPPSTEAVRNSIMILKELGGLERVCVENGFMPNDGKLTYIGRIMVSLPLDVRLSKLIVFGYIYSVLEETIIIAAGLSINSVFSFRYQNKLQIYYSKLRWADGSGCDLIAILNAYKMWQFKSEQGHFTENYQQEIDWCSRNNLERKSLHEMRDLIQEIKSRLLDLQIEKHAGVSWEAHEKPLVLKICFAGAFMPNFYMIGDPSEENALTVYKTTNGRDPTKTVYFKGVKRFAGEVIYENTIKTRLVEMGISRRSKDIKVIFEDGSSKIFIQFVGEESMVDDEDSDNVQRKFQSSNRIAGRVKPDVYKALKMRQSEERFHINVMSEEMTVLYAQEHGLDLSPREVFGPPKGMMNHPELCALPSTCTETLVGRVTYIFHCGKFFIQPASKADKDLLEKMQNDLLLDSFFTFKSVAELNPHQFIVVKDGVIYKRAKAVNINSQMRTVTCFLFDYGETNESSIELVFGISEGSHHQAVFKIPERCFSASLSEIAPSFIKCPRGLWTSKAVDLFKELVANREVTVKIHSVVEEIAAVELWIDGLCVNKELIRTGFAQEFEEIFPRKHNQELRKMIQTSDSLRFDAKDEFASRHDTLVTKFAPSPKAEDCNKTLWLQGPHSPLETKPFSILVQSQASTSIDSRSVNSVLLLEEPENHSGRLLVAANATESGRGVMLHETTIMPNIPGLPVLLALMFAPDIAIKRNSDRTAFESIQFGLGCNPVTRKPYFGQHDCILPFNIDIAEEDFYEINHLRFVMSYLLMTQHMHEVPSLDDAAKLELLQLVKEKTMSILGKKHLQLPTTCASNSDGRWIVEDQSDNQTYVVDIIDAGGFFPLLSCPPVYPLEEAKKEKLKKDLQRALSEVTFGSTQGGIVKKKWFLCPLCDIIFEDSFSLKIHMMSSKAHLNLYKKLIPTDDDGTDQGV